MDDIEKARARLAKAAARKEMVHGVQAIFGDDAGICDECEAIVASRAIHKDWHQRFDGPHFEQGAGR